MRTMTRRVGAVLIAAAVAALASTLASPLPAVAAAPEAQGWWWRAQTGAVVAVPAPPQVPPGGLYVEGAPDGANAVSALRLRAPARTVGTALVLKVADERGGDGAVLLACPATEAWTPAAAGPWEERPEAACEGQGVLGQRAEDGSTWTFSFAVAPITGVRDVVLLPGRDDSRPEGFNGAVFSIAFQPPDNATLVTTTSAGPGEPFRPDPPPDQPPATPPGGFGGTAPAFTPPPPPPLAEFPPAPDTAPGTADPSVIQPRVSAPVPAPAEQPVSDPKDARALATLVALLSVGVAGVLSRARAVALPGGRMPGAGGTADERLGGVGRFRRPRSSPPPPL